MEQTPSPAPAETVTSPATPPAPVESGGTCDGDDKKVEVCERSGFSKYYKGKYYAPKSSIGGRKRKTAKKSKKTAKRKHRTRRGRKSTRA